MTYMDFLRSKIVTAPGTGFAISDSDINPALKPHQRDAVKWAVAGGRRGLFERFGLGKTVQELEYCRIVTEHEGGKALIVLRWAGTVAPRVIMLENVEEFQTWGPVRRGRPIKSKAGQTFRRFIEQLKALGYVVEWRELVAADYGAPTTRKRFFLIARRDGRPIVWPEPPHAPADSPEVKAGKKLPCRSGAEPRFARWRSLKRWWRCENRHRAHAGGGK